VSEELDPEVVADLRLRAYSERDSSRARVSEHHLATFRPDDPVAEWKCRNPNCARFMPVTQEAIDRLDDANRHWPKKAGQPPLKSYEVAMCDACSQWVKDNRSQRLRDKVTKLADLIRRLKDSTHPREATELLADIAKCHHPDIPGLLDAIEAKRASKGDKRGKAGGL
jgi:hypothetical protein